MIFSQPAIKGPRNLEGQGVDVGAGSRTAKCHKCFADGEAVPSVIGRE